MVYRVEQSPLSTDTGKSDRSSSCIHNSDPLIKSDVCIECSPVVGGLQNQVSASVVPSAPKRRITCFLRTKSEGAIAVGGISGNLPSVVDAANEPLATVQALPGSWQDQIKEVRDVKQNNKRTYKPLQSNSMLWQTSAQDSEVVAKRVCCECNHSIESSNYQQKVLKLSKIDGNELCQKMPAAMQTSGKALLAVCWNGGFAGSASSYASTVTHQKVSMQGQLPVNIHDATCCTTVPLSTSNIVNVNRPCSITGQNNVGIRQHVIVVKRCQNLLSTTVSK